MVLHKGRRLTLPLGGLLLLLVSSFTQAQHQPAPQVRRTTSQQTRTARATAYTNPVFDTDFPDPTVMRSSDGWYYAYATQGIINGRTINIQVARSKNLVHWEHLGDALPVKPVWANQTQKFWAPHVSQHGNTYYMYFSADPNTLTGLCLAVATAKSPRGPFTDSGQPLKCGESFINIDPMAFDDPKTGKRLLYWGSGHQPIKVQELADDRLSFKPDSQPIELIKADKNIPYQSLIEGAWVVERDGYYYLFYSGENCCHGPLNDLKYAVMVARSRSATGPFETLAQATGKSDSVILRRNNLWIAPGHNSIFTDAAGQSWIAYHAINANKPYLSTEVSGDRSVRRVMLLDRIVYHNGWPHIESGTPSTTQQRGPIVR